MAARRSLRTRRTRHGPLGLSAQGPPNWTDVGPVINTQLPPTGWSQPGVLSNWNDPCLLGDAGALVMYASVGRAGLTGGADTRRDVYRLTSANGIAWTLDPATPVLGPADEGNFGEIGPETPCVVDTGVVGATRYRMWFTAIVPENPDRFTMGYATSADGETFTIVGEVDICQGVVNTAPITQFGSLARAEPLVLVIDGTYHLYYTDVRTVTDPALLWIGSRPGIERSIGHATSADGETWTEQDHVLLPQSFARYAQSQGFSGPGGLVDSDGRVWLVPDVFRLPQGETDGTNLAQDEIASFVSHDGGWTFELAEPQITVAGRYSWCTRETRAPGLLELSDGRWLMYYGYDNRDMRRPNPIADAVSGDLSIGIALSIRDAEP